MQPNGYQFNESCYLTINNVIYEGPITDIPAGFDIFHGKIESESEIKEGFKTDYLQAFDKWYINSATNINNYLAVISNNLTIQRVNNVKDEISD